MILAFRMIDIAIVIVNWNGKKYLKDCFDSLQRQTYKNFRIIFVDNGSSDGSVDFIERNYLETEFPSLDVVQLKENTGFCFGYNTGIKKALEDKTIEYVIVLNNDTKLDEKFIEKIADCAKRHLDAGSIQPKVLNFFEKDKIDCAGIYIARDGTAHNRGYGERVEKYNDEKEIFGANGTASLFTRRALEKTALSEHNYFDNDHFVFYEDVDLAWRLKSAGFKPHYCPQALLWHIHGGTAGKTSLMKAYYLHRNYFFTIFKNYPCGKLAKTLFWRFISYLKLVANIFRKKKRETEFTKGHSKIKVAAVILKAWGSVVWNLPSLIKKRKFIRKNIYETQA
jgi:GT2 family glycosyltransferase